MGVIYSSDQVRRNFKNFIKKSNGNHILFLATVIEVDENKAVCDVSPLDGNPDYFDVSFVLNTDKNIDGFIAIPAIGSLVLCGIMENEFNIFILMTSEISKCIIKCSNNGNIELNGNKYSVVNGETLQKEINILRDDLNSLISNYNTHTHVLTISGGLTGSAAPTVSTDLASKADFSNILNETVKHGDD